MGYMKRTLLLLLLLTVNLAAQPRTPYVYVNDKFKLVQLAISQRATLSYDLSPIGGEHLMVKLFRHNQTLDQEPMREWLFHGQAKRERISLKDLPISLYTVVAYCCDENGQALAYAAPIIHIEYGGWRAWEDFKPPVEVVKNKPETFSEVEAATKTQNRDLRIGLNPPAVVIRPGEVVDFKPVFHNMEPESVTWKLVGEGELKAIEDGQYRYTAPAEQIGAKLYRVEIKSVAPICSAGAV